MKYNKPKLKCSEILSQKELENGIWQFLIDHSVPFEKDLWLVKFLQISTKEDLMRRIYARASGLYKIKDEEQIKKQMEKKVEYYKGLQYGDKVNRTKQSLLIKLRNKCKWKYDFIMLCRKQINKLINKWTNEI